MFKHIRGLTLFSQSWCTMPSCLTCVF